jgi:CRISPR-associated protein Cas1
MEPYRPYVDNLVCEIIADGEDIATLSKEVKARLLNIPVLDVTIEGNRRPLMNAVTQTTASLYNCFSGRLRKIKYPTFEA